MLLPVPPHTDCDDDLAVWADALSVGGEPLGAFVNAGLRGHFEGAMLASHGARWFGALAAYFEPAGTWERARLIGLQAKPGPIQPVLEAMGVLSTVRILDLSERGTVSTSTLEALFTHPQGRRLEELQVQLPWTWMPAMADLIHGRPMPKFTLISRFGSLQLRQSGGQEQVFVRGDHPMLDRGCRELEDHFDVVSIVRS